VPVHTMKAYRGSRGIAPLILDLVSRWSGVAGLVPPGKETLVPTE
jgi:hypothetical protein